MTTFFFKVFGTFFLLSPPAGIGTISLDLPVSAPPETRTVATAEITAGSILIFDLANNGEVFAQAADTERPIASLTKLMTALIILENHALDEVVKIPGGILTVEGKKAWLMENERITVENLLKILLISSANDAALALAIFDSGSEAAFVEKMNARATTLGLVHTHFQNSHGLDEEEHYSSARDLALLTAFLLRERRSVFREIINTKEAVVSSVSGNVYPLETTNDLLYSDPYVFGVKTGTTDEAGECLISLIKRDGREILFVVLGSTARFRDTEVLTKEFFGG